MATLFARNANVTHDATNSSTRSQNSCALAPDFIDFSKKCVVILDFAKLALVLFVLFQRPIGRRGDDKMNASIWNPREIACIAEAQTMFGSVKRRGPWMRPVIFVKRQQFVDRAPFIVCVINLRVSGIKNPWGRRVCALFFRPMMAKTVAVTRRTALCWSAQLELFLFFDMGPVF